MLPGTELGVSRTQGKHDKYLPDLIKISKDDGCVLGRGDNGVEGGRVVQLFLLFRYQNLYSKTWDPFTPDHWLQ